MKALIIINDLAGGHSGTSVEQLIRQELQEYPHAIRSNVILEVTDSFEHMQTLIKTHQPEIDRVIAAGGDGTIISIISMIMGYPNLKLGIIPLGTGNRLASNLEIPGNIKGALHTALTGEPHFIDVGRINDRYFALMAGAGLDAEIMAEVQPLEKKALGIFAYFWRGVCHAFQARFAVFEIEADGKIIRSRGIGVVVANAGNLLGQYFTLTPGAKPDDGLFDICILGSRSRTDYWTNLIHILSQQYRGEEYKGIRHLRAKHIVIRSRPLVKAQADGDVIGTTPITIEALPRAVAILVPHYKVESNPISNTLQSITDHLRLMMRDLLK